MLLQADPTVQYALGHHVGRVLYKDLTIDSPYNTYVHKGLPPGPVASPGVASLIAAANPANVPYLYFVASRDGHHEFRMTLEQHTNAIRQVRAQMPAKKSTPRMLAMAPTARSNSTPARAVSKPSSTKTASAKTASAKTASAKTASAKTTSARTTSAKPSVKTPAKSSSKKKTSRSTQTRKTASATTGASR
jgi:hypothetical protein